MLLAFHKLLDCVELRQSELISVHNAHIELVNELESLDEVIVILCECGRTLELYQESLKDHLVKLILHQDQSTYPAQVGFKLDLVLKAF